MSHPLNGKIIVITGASSGLGEETARHLATFGAKVVLGARRTERLEKIVADIRQSGGEALAVATDVTRREDTEKLAQTTLQAFGRIDVLVNNAGIMPIAPMSELHVDEWSHMIDVNIKGVLHGIAAVLPGMIERRDGHIINLSSVAGLRVSSGGGTVYSATKFAVKAISEGLRAEMAEHNIRVTTLYPGAVASELTSGTRDPVARARLEKYYAENEISADAVARAIAYAITQPADVAINEITIRPTRQNF